MWSCYLATHLKRLRFLGETSCFEKNTPETTTSKTLYQDLAVLTFVKPFLGSQLVNSGKYIKNLAQLYLTGAKSWGDTSVLCSSENWR